MQGDHQAGRRSRWLAPLVRGVALAAVVGGMGTMGCLSRPVTHRDPTTKTNFTTTVKQSAVDKVDLLFMIDNSRSMGDKQELLALAVPDLVSRLLNPNCLDPEDPTRILGISKNGDCSEWGTTVKPEFPPVHDMHVGIVSSSLGGRGSSTCPPDAKNPENPDLNGHNDDKGHLLNRGGDDERRIPELTATQQGAVVDPNFLAWFPPVDKNTGKPEPPVTAITDPQHLADVFSDMVIGVHEYGCGYEAQLESWYRFLVQPDPYYSIDPDPDDPGRRRVLTDYDDVLLQQRHDFLRPDSLVAIIMVTDENDSTVDPMSLGRQGWAFEQTPGFPGSTTGYAPRGTIECENNPNDPNCTSCAFIADDDPSFLERCPGGKRYYDQADDNANIRFFHMKRRFGVDPQFPISRYVRALTQPRVPDRNGEHFNGASNYTGDQHANCTNPLFAASLPTSANEEMCNLPLGPRSSDLIFLAVIGGVPHQLLQVDPTDPDSPQKDTLTEADWNKILGRDPLNYDFTGIDQHMIESTGPRPGLPPPSSIDNADPVHGREWNTKKADLQYACTFNLRTPKNCDPNPTSDFACDCNGSADRPPLCNYAEGLPNQQIRGKAYPTIRELAVVRELGPRGIVSSLCPIHETDNEDGTDPLFGYRPAVKAIVDRLKDALSNQCLPQQLHVDELGRVPCLILEILPNKDMTCASKGLQTPDAEIERRLREQLHEEFLASGQADAAGAIDQSTLPICELEQIVTEPGKTCVDSDKVGWCYVTGAAANGCPQAITFSALGTPVVGATVKLQCIEQAAVPDSGTRGR